MSSRQRAEREANSAMAAMDRHCIDINKVLMEPFESESINSYETCMQTGIPKKPISDQSAHNSQVAQKEELEF